MISILLIIQKLLFYSIFLNYDKMKFNFVIVQVMILIKFTCAIKD